MCTNVPPHPPKKAGGLVGSKSLPVKAGSKLMLKTGLQYFRRKSNQVLFSHLSQVQEGRVLERGVVWGWVQLTLVYHLKWEN